MNLYIAQPKSIWDTYIVAILVAMTISKFIQELCMQGIMRLSSNLNTVQMVSNLSRLEHIQVMFMHRSCGAIIKRKQCINSNLHMIYFGYFFNVHRLCSI